VTRGAAQALAVCLCVCSLANFPRLLCMVHCCRACISPLSMSCRVVLCVCIALGSSSRSLAAVRPASAACRVSLCICHSLCDPSGLSFVHTWRMCGIALRQLRRASRFELACDCYFCSASLLSLQYKPIHLYPSGKSSQPRSVHSAGHRSKAVASSIFPSSGNCVAPGAPGRCQ
jgi:hypothetical protein